MGPQPSSRGNPAGGISPSRSLPASMGPQPSSRGNVTLHLCRPHYKRLLQWGRNLPVAEIENGMDMDDYMDDELQWGRNLPVAEINPSRTRRPHRANASMGPQPSSRGNSKCLRGFPRVCPGLQWGRNLPVAEMMCPTPDCSDLCRFNGAATFQSRKWG